MSPELEAAASEWLDENQVEHGSIKSVDFDCVDATLDIWFHKKDSDVRTWYSMPGDQIESFCEFLASRKP